MVFTEIMCSEAIKQNRFSAEFFDPKYTFAPNSNYVWQKIGRFLKVCQYGVSISMNEKGKGFPILRMNELENCFAIEPTKYANISEKEYQQFKVNVNDILFNRTNSIDFVGRTGIVKDEFESVFASYLIKIVPDRNYVNPEYLTIYLNTTFGIGQIKRRAMPSINQANVSAAEMKHILVPILPFNEQEQISNLVNEAHRKKQLSQSLYTRAQELLERELGLDKLVFEKPLSYEARLSEVVGNNRADAEFYQPMYLKLRTLVRNYKHGFSKLTDIAFSLPPNVDPGKFANTEFEYVELSSINPTLGIIGKGTKLLGKEAPSRARRKLETGDILASAVVGSVDKAAIVDSSSNDKLASTGFFQFRPKQIKSEYLLILVRSKLITMQLQQEATGGILSAVPDNRLHNVIIPTLPDDLQCEISDLVYKSHKLFHKSQQLLEQAKRRVEELIEQGVQK